MRLTLPMGALVGKERVDEVTAGEHANNHTDCSHSRDTLSRCPTLYISPKMLCSSTNTMDIVQTNTRANDSGVHCNDSLVSRDDHSSFLSRYWV